MRFRWLCFPPSFSVVTFHGDLLVSTHIFPTEMFSRPAHASKPFLTPTTPPNPPQLWAPTQEHFHLQVKLPLSNWACGENCENLTRSNSSVCSMALDGRVFSRFFQTPEIYLNYLTCENKIPQERKVLSLSEWASESRIHFPRASLCSDFWLQTQPENEETLKGFGKHFQLGLI